MTTRNCGIVLLALVLFKVPADVEGADRQRRLRGEGLYQCAGSNTAGAGNLWISGRSIAFLWDNPDTGRGIAPFLFAETRLEWGVLGTVSIVAESRPISYIWAGRPQMGSADIGIKATAPNNKDLRYHGWGVELKYSHGFVRNFPSIAGYRIGGTGFSPEGFTIEGGSIVASLLYDRDYIARSSTVPVKVFGNIGLRIPTTQWLLPYSQYRMALGAAYVGLTFDAFVEVVLDGFFDQLREPKRFSWDLAAGNKVWEVAFLENTLFATPGVRMRYDRGTVITLAAPLLLSVNRGSSMTTEDKRGLDISKFPDEMSRGITDPFDPWYARWKLIVELSLPIVYRETAAELRRIFLLKKILNRKPTVDLNRVVGTEDEEEEDEQARARRLHEIQKRRQEILETE